MLANHEQSERPGDSSSANILIGSRGPHSTRSLSLLSAKMRPCVLKVVAPQDGILSWPPTSHTVKLMFLYSGLTLKPIVGMVVWLQLDIQDGGLSRSI